MKPYQKTAPVGLDYTIQMIQDMQERLIPGMLGVLAADCKFFGRGEIVEKEGVKVPCIYNGKDYEKLGMDDRFNLVTYMVIDQDRPNTNPDLTNVSLFVHGNVQVIYPTLTTRPDENLRDTYKEFVYAMIEPIQMRSVEIIDDLQPIHSFKINFTI